MERYVSFLRGINVSGKNKIAMSELKNCFEQLNYVDVVTYINSGNIVFSTDEQNIAIITKNITTMIQKQFNLNIPSITIEQKELSEIFSKAPDWWNRKDKSIYDNMILIIPPTTFADVYKEIGEAKQEVEKIHNYKNVIYWSFIKSKYSKTNWIKTAASKINDCVTIRNANTIKKVLEL